MVLHIFGTVCLALLALDSIMLNGGDGRTAVLTLALSAMIIWALWS
jgi:hypothetical protein